jgi:predicted SAM-dependent methyltransferase
MILQHGIVKKHKCTILTLAPEPQCFWKLGVSYLFEDLRSSPFKDEWFDAIACVSVIEHVGMDNTIYSNSNAHRESRPLDYLVAIRELKRIMKVGGSLFITVPFGAYEDHGWLQQFDSKLLASLITEFAPQGIDKMFFRYTMQGWQVSREDACEDLSYFNAHACEAKSRNQRSRPHDLAVAARGVACIELVK